MGNSSFFARHRKRASLARQVPVNLATAAYPGWHLPSRAPDLLRACLSGAPLLCARRQDGGGLRHPQRPIYTKCRGRARAWPAQCVMTSFSPSWGKCWPEYYSAINSLSPWEIGTGCHRCTGAFGLPVV